MHFYQTEQELLPLLLFTFLTSLQGPPNVQSPAAWSAMARLSVWNQSSLSPTELKGETANHTWRSSKAWHLQYRVKQEKRSLVPSHCSFQDMVVRCSPGWESDGDVRHLDPEAVQYVVEDRFAHLCVCVRDKNTSEFSQKSLCAEIELKIIRIKNWKNRKGKVDVPSSQRETVCS